MMNLARFSKLTERIRYHRDRVNYLEKVLTKVVAFQDLIWVDIPKSGNNMGEAQYTIYSAEMQSCLENLTAQIEMEIRHSKKNADNLYRFLKREIFASSYEDMITEPD